jgi:hypothetical protein
MIILIGTKPANESDVLTGGCTHCGPTNDGILYVPMACADPDEDAHHLLTALLTAMANIEAR